MSESGGASHWCKGVLEEAQAANPGVALSSPGHGPYPLPGQQLSSVSQPIKLYEVVCCI